jgi:hypothetical protein
MRFRLIDTEGNKVGELPDYEGTPQLGDMIVVNDEDWKVVGHGGLRVADLVSDDQPVLVVRRV